MAKKNDTTDEATSGAEPAGTDETLALRAQNDQMLDMLVEMRTELDTLKANQAAGLVAAPDFTEEARLDTELDALLDEFKDYPQVDVFRQRVLAGADANLSIRLAGDLSATEDPSGDRCHWKLRWFNFAKEGRAQAAAAEGYEKVRWTDLADPEMVSTGVRTDDWVRKGDRGMEVLMRLPLKLYVYKKKRDAAKLQGLLSSESRVRDHVANNVSTMAGKAGDNASQAGDFIHDKTFVTIKQGERERVTL